ncbi:hypothetical protein [Mesobacillus subterraneus]|uniref:hypothetical protein n=1 Tax=Mesobacillus subterraneus TaxID=285983 RepID=UPI001B87B87D|nr:hypothetical protein [Mesobacillus subterraneus]
MKNKYFSEIAVPIESPYGFMPGNEAARDFTFDKENRFKDYRLKKDEKTYDISFDDYGQWYFFISFECGTLDELKLSRQIFRPPYLKEDKLALVELLDKLEINPFYEGHDKAYGHVLSLVPALDSISAFDQARLANYDGNDDPTIIKKIHFIENEYKGERTRFISGFETRSFATVTENQYYAKEIHLPGNARTYLKLFIYFSRYGILPSQQMMPRFLGNLWASTQSLNTRANAALYKEESIE